MLLPHVVQAVIRYTPRAAACLALAVVAAACTSAQGTSSVRDARVTAVDGKPCFSVPAARDTSSTALRLYSLTVTQTERIDWRSLPPEMWGFTVDPPGAALDSADSSACIRYGALPAAGRSHGVSRELEAARIYRVEINARPANGDSATLGYQARFCVKPQAGHAAEVREVTWDERARRWRDEVCLGD